MKEKEIIKFIKLSFENKDFKSLNHWIWTLVKLKEEETQRKFEEKLDIACSKVNKKLHDDEFGTYEWNEYLYEELEINRFQ